MEAGDTPEVVETVPEEPLDIEQIDAEPVKAAEADPNEAPKADAKSAPTDPDALLTSYWKVVDEALPENAADDLPEYIATLTPDLIRELPAPARNLVRTTLLAKRKLEAAWTAKDAAKDKAVAERESAVVKKEAELLRKQAEFAALWDDPKIKEVLAKADADLPDPLTPEGQAALVDKKVAEGLKRIAGPVVETQAKLRQQAAWMEFREANPEMKDEKVQAEILTIVQSEKVTTPQALEMWRGRKAATEAANRRAVEMKRRQEAAARMGRSTVHGNPDNEPIPADVRKRGPAAVYDYLEANPAARRLVEAQRAGLR